VRDLIEAGLSELGDAAVVMGFVAACSVKNARGQELAQSVYPRSAA
jgi:hypothetical protein